MWWRDLEIYGQNRKINNTAKVEVGPRQNTLLGETAPPTSQFVRFLRFVWLQGL